MFSVGDEQAREDVRDGKVRKRCGNCPTNGCVGCPLAAENPEYQKCVCLTQIAPTHLSQAPSSS